MAVAITTKFLGPTNTKPSRIKATCERGSVTLSWEYSYDAEVNHLRAAKALAKRLDLPTDLIGGSLPGSGFAFVIAH